MVSTGGRLRVSDGPVLFEDAVHTTQCQLPVVSKFMTLDIFLYSVGNGWGFDKKNENLSKIPVGRETNINQMYQKGPTWGLSQDIDYCALR